MKNIPTDWICDCPMECNTISFSFSVVVTPFDPEEMCPKYNNFDNDYDFDDFLMKPFYDRNRIFSPKFEKKLLEIKNNVSMTYAEDEDCKENLSYRAVVNFKLVTDTMSVTVLSRRLSFFDKLSAFGKSTKYIH